jgi:hypothetical protein
MTEYIFDLEPQQAICDMERYSFEEGAAVTASWHPPLRNQEDARRA